MENTVKMNWVLFGIGAVIVLLAPLLGDALSGIYLYAMGGMEGDAFARLAQGCIHSVQIIGVLTAVSGRICR